MDAPAHSKPDPVEGAVALISRVEAVPTILEVICRTTGMGFVVIARVTSDRWIACEVLDRIQFGLKPGEELEIATTLCNEIRQSGQPVVIDHVAEDALYRTHLTPAQYGFQSYISVPIVLRSGEFFGTLCAIDPRPAPVNRPEILDMFRMFADLIAFQIEATERVAASEARLTDERETAELREQFIAVLGHDLRNPVAGIAGGAKLLLKMPLPPKAAEIVGMMRTSAERMSGLIDNVLDLARGRLGGGISLRREPVAVEPLLRELAAELLAGAPGRDIELDIEQAGTIDADPSRLSQMVSNLIANALTHGAADAPVRVRAKGGPDGFEMSVSNAGRQIPPDAVERLFQPFSRARHRGRDQGLGLGLYIASEIAHAHDGRLTVTSSAKETRFTFTMPAPAGVAPLLAPPVALPLAG